jgi:hypothetical protein
MGPPDPPSAPWNELRATLSSLGDAFGNDAAGELEAAGDVRAAEFLRAALRGDPPGSGAAAAKAAWDRLQTGVGWTTPAWRECYVLGQLREAAEAGERADVAADDANERDDESETALLRRAMLAVDMAHIMGGPGEIVQRFGAAIEALIARRGGKDATSTTTTTTTTTGAAALIPNALPVRAAVKIDPAHALERADGITPKEFKRRFFNADKPCALGAIGAAWPAIEKWRNLEWFKATHGHRNVPLEIGAYDDAKRWREETMPLSRFIDEYLLPGLEEERAAAAAGGGGGEEGGGGDEEGGGAKNVAYLAQHQLFEQLPSLLRDFDAPDVCGVAGGVQRVNAWIGTAGTVTPCHFDSYDNLLGQVAGYKFVRLYAESDGAFMYRHAGAWAENRSWPGAEEEEEEEGEGENGRKHAAANEDGGGGGGGEDEDGAAAMPRGRRNRDAQGNISRVDVERPDLTKFPLFANATHMDVVIGPGEFIYIPARCWHYVRALTTSVSLNFLF